MKSKEEILKILANAREKRKQNLGMKMKKVTKMEKKKCTKKKVKCSCAS